MAVRSNILYVSGTGSNAALRIMSSAQLTKLKELAAYFYSQNPVETLTYVASNGNLSPTMTDSRMQAGAATTGRVSSYASEAATADISQIDETYDRVSRTRISSTSASEPNENGTNNAFPCYWDGATKTIRAMTKQDFFDTIIGPTITDGLVGTGSVNALAAGTYTVLTNSSSISGSPGTTIVSTNPIFVDKVANVSAYSAAGIPETLDQPTTNNSYYLHLITANKPTYEMPVFLRSDGTGVQEYTTATFEDMVDEYIQSATYGKAGYSITYEMDTSSNVTNRKGTNINDRYYSGSSADGYTTYLATQDDYRTQEFPNGSLAIRNSWALGVTTGVSYSVSASVSSVNEGGSVTFTVTTSNVAPGSVPYTITGISSADLSAGSLTGNITTTGTYSSATGTTSITLDNDATTEGTETITFTAGGSSVQVTVNDTSQTVVETVSLEGSTVAPETNNGFPLSDGSLGCGWRFRTNGDVQEFDADELSQYSSTGHNDWVNQSPTNNYWIRGTIYAQSASSNQIQDGAALNTWLQLNLNRSFRFQDNRASASYGNAYVTYKIEIASDSAGSNILATGYYRTNYEGGA